MVVVAFVMSAFVTIRIGVVASDFEVEFTNFAPTGVLQVTEKEGGREGP
jgi:hypothetical protein